MYARPWPTRTTISSVVIPCIEELEKEFIDAQRMVDLPALHQARPGKYCAIRCHPERTPPQGSDPKCCKAQRSR